MRIAPLALVALAGIGCRRGALQADAGPGFITSDAAPGDGTPGSDGQGRADVPGLRDARGPTADANCGLSKFTATYLATELFIVLDRSISVETAQWNNFLSAVTTTISRHSADIDWGLYAFPPDGPACASFDRAIDVEIAPGNGTHVLAHILAAGTGAGGTPTGSAINVAAAYMLARTTTNPKFLVLVTDGAPTCAMATMSSDPTRAQAEALAAVGTASIAGLPTIVLAPSTTSTPADVAALNALAVAGGNPRQPPGPQFTTEVTFPDLFSPVSTSCVFGLEGRPPVPDIVSVILDGTPVPRDRSHVVGWDYLDAAATVIELYGSWCETLLSSRTFELDVYYGCTSGDDGL